MRLFDTHCHFETTDASAIEPILVRAAEAGVAKLTAVGGSNVLNAGALAAEQVANALRANGRPVPEVLVALGYDRDQCGKEAAFFSHATGMSRPRCASSTPRAALGEIGLDYHYSPETREAQIALFAAQLEEARRENLPVVIHTREAADDTIGLLKEIPSRGIIHCFTGEPEEAKAYLDLGFFISISGIVTFKAADNVRASALVVPDDRILIETDAPFLAPVPMRGKANESAFVRHTCEFLSALRKTEVETFAERTFSNAERAFSEVLPFVVVRKKREQFLRKARALDLEEVSEAASLGIGHDAVVPVADVTAQE